MTTSGRPAALWVSPDRCRCLADADEPARECPLHGEPEVMLAEVTAEAERLRTALRSVHCELYEDEGTRDGAFAVIDEALGGAPTDLVGHVAKVLHRDWSALPDWELRSAARFTLGAIRADGKVVVDRADLEAVNSVWDCPVGKPYGDEDLDRADEAMNRLRAALADPQDGAGRA